MEGFENYFEFLTTGPRIIGWVVGLVIWTVVGNILGNKARSLGLSYAGHFCLCFFLRIIGLCISLILMDKRKKEIFYSQNQQCFYNQQPQQLYGQPQQPYEASWQNMGANNDFYNSPTYKAYEHMYSNGFGEGHQRYMQTPGQDAQYGGARQYFSNSGDINNYPGWNENFDYRTPGVNVTYTCPHCGTVQDIPGRCLNCSEKVVNYYPFT